MVDVYAEDWDVTKISVQGGYRGRLMGRLGIGSTIVDIEGIVAPVEENIYDQFVIMGIPCLSFEIAGSFPNRADLAFWSAPIKEITLAS